MVYNEVILVDSGALTVAGYSRESHVHLDSQFFTPASVYDNRRVHSNPTIVEELKHGDR